MWVRGVFITEAATVDLKLDLASLNACKTTDSHVNNRGNPKLKAGFDQITLLPRRIVLWRVTCAQC